MRHKVAIFFNSFFQYHCVLPSVNRNEICIALSKFQLRYSSDFSTDVQQSLVTLRECSGKLICNS